MELKQIVDIPVSKSTTQPTPTWELCPLVSHVPSKLTEMSSTSSSDRNIYQNSQHALSAQIALSEKAPAVQVDLAVYTGHWLSGGRCCSAVLVGPCSHKRYSTLIHLTHTQGKKTQSVDHKRCNPLHLWKLDTVCIVSSHALQYRGIKS